MTPDNDERQLDAVRAELRRRQILGLLLLAALILAISIWRARHGLFSPGWWRLW